MKKVILTFGLLCSLLLSCGMSSNSTQSGMNLPTSNASSAELKSFEANNTDLPKELLDTYYLPSDDPVNEYLQHKSIQKFFNMWFKEYIGEDINAHWNYDTLAPVDLLDHNFKSIARAGETFYTCTFSTDDDRCGYIIVKYGVGEEGRYIQKWSLFETTPYQYDLKVNGSQIAAALKKTDIDLSTASAKRVEWIDTEKKRGDRIVLFTDGKNDKYIYYFGEEDFIIEKQ